MTLAIALVATWFMPFVAPMGTATAQPATADTQAIPSVEPPATPPSETTAPAPPAPDAAPVLELTSPSPSPPDGDGSGASVDLGFAESALLDAQIRQNEERVANSRQVLTWNGYVDFGFFVPQGDGSGYVQDYGHVRFPEYSQYSWVFLGDILSTAVNSRGEVADLGTAPGVDRFDSINSRGAAGFAVNEVNMRLTARPAPTAIITASINFTPRTGSDFSLGDVFDVDLAQLEWLPTESQRTSIFLGKMESVLGIEYRDRKADRRFGVTPSLIARYTTGTALGVKLRTKLGSDDQVIFAAALTNGSNTTEQFHFYDEIDSNTGKTGSARLSFKLPVPGRTEIGASGSYGPQDRTTSNAHAMWFVGGDLLSEIGDVTLKAEWLTGGAAGDASQGVYELKLHGGGYVEMDAMLTPSWGLLGRIEYRDAFVALGTDRAYITRSWRATVGGRWVFSRWAALKAEFLHNGEYGRIPQVRNDVFTSSIVLSY